MTFVISPKSKINGAKKNHIEYSIELIEVLNEFLKGNSNLEPEVKRYFIECFDNFLKKANKDLKDSVMQTLIARSLNLVRGKGKPAIPRQGIQTIEMLFVHLRQIANPNKSIEEIIMMHMSEREQYAVQYKNGQTETLVKRYRACKKKHGWDENTKITAPSD